ncbi:hypothetical protein BKA69DRAFT_273484 [Paraphysoderma sedebokerense]|nr:hypothetical protein BKA69DRAFT_273484 [Paraphysoderma sedebokerense]
MKRPRTETELSQATSATAPPRKQSRLLADLVPENVIDQPKASVIKFGLKSVTAQPSIPLTSNQDDLNGEEIDSDIDTVKYYPAELTERSQFISDKTRRKVTPFQFKVYDCCRQVPKGKLTTYKAISDYLSSAPRAVGQALKNNPFAPLNPYTVNSLILFHLQFCQILVFFLQLSIQILPLSCHQLVHFRFTP